MRHVIVIGGGPAGMMAAYRAAMGGAKVTLLEQNEKLGKKLFITGKGRCNVCNATDRDGVFQNICTNSKFMYSAFSEFDNKALMELLEQAGCPLKIERGERVFPVSDHAYDVTDAMKRLLNKPNVKILLHTKVKEILLEEITLKEDIKKGDLKKDAKEWSANKRIKGVMLENGKNILADACIICTGGVSYPSTGSTGDGYGFAESLGHKVTERRPALVPLETVEKWPADVMGLSLKNVSLRMMRGKKKLYEGFGEMMFTHFGVTGPLVLSASSFLADKKNTGESTKLFIDLKPALDAEQLDKRLQKDFEENKGKQFKNALGALFPASLEPVMVKLSGIDPNKSVSEISKGQRLEFGKLIKNVPLEVKGTRGFEEAIITQGGVSVKEVNPSTMESKLVQGLFFAGEVLDLDAMTGGFNLQIAWSTGFLAGKCAAGSQGN